MKVNDSLIGMILLVLSLVVLWHVREFPNIPGQTYGASLFPTVVAGGLAICSVLLIASGVRSGQPLFATGPATPRKSLVALAVTMGVLVGYVLLVNRLGFFLTACAALLILMRTYGVKLTLAIPLALVSTAVIHTAFYKMLGVPLPWGIFIHYAW